MTPEERAVLIAMANAMLAERSLRRASMDRYKHPDGEQRVENCYEALNRSYDDLETAVEDLEIKALEEA